MSFIVEAGEHPLKGSIRVQKYPFRVWSWSGGRSVVKLALEQSSSQFSIRHTVY